MTLTIAHIVNPVLVDPSSDLFLAQPITFESMRRARVEVLPKLRVTLYSAQYAEDKKIVPRDFLLTADLTRSVLDVGEFNIPRKLPLLRDILARLYDASMADYLIYTNVDIGLQPHFYSAVVDYIHAGYDSFVINRRTIPATNASASDIEALYAETGIPHRGWDCFVFPRSIYPSFKLYDVCIGTARVGLSLLANLMACSDNFKEFRDEQLTFHIGDKRSGRRKDFADYDAHNTHQLDRILSDLELEQGPFDPRSIPGSYMHRRRKFGSLYDLWSRYAFLPYSLSRVLNRLSGRRS
jgi:hypothetical protein